MKNAPLRSNSFETSQNPSNILFESSNKAILTDMGDSKQGQDRAFQVKNPYKEKYMKLSQTIKVVYLSIKRRLVKEDPNCLPSLRDIVSTEEDDETVVKKDPIHLAQCIKKIYEKTIEHKNEEKKRLHETSEKGMSQYEPHLQKLEAEVRKHIQIEQHMKILIDNHQERIRELEKANPKKTDSDERVLNEIHKEYKEKIDENDKMIKEIEQENSALREQLRASQSEILKLKSSLGSIGLILKGIESSKN